MNDELINGTHVPSELDLMLSHRRTLKQALYDRGKRDFAYIPTAHDQLPTLMMCDWFPHWFTSDERLVYHRGVNEAYEQWAELQAR